jgi:transcriptional regulator with GAF, ATPase, and Fis domain
VTAADAVPPDERREVARLGSVPASHAVVDGALRLVTALASETMEGADGVSVSLLRHGRLATVAASDDTVLQMDAHQYASGEGPCIAAAAAGCWFHSPALAEEERWPSFVPLARGQGIASILSSPLLTGDRPIGALNIYSNRERVFGARQQELATLFATQTSAILEEAGAAIAADDLDRSVLEALRSREVIAQAQGVLIGRQGVSPEDAADLLRRSARDGRITVVAEAERVIGSAGSREPGDG